MPSSEDPSKRRKHHQSDSSRRDRSERGESRQRSAGKPQAESKSGAPLRTIVIALTVIIVLAGGVAVAVVGFGGGEEESSAFCGGFKAGHYNLTSIELYGCRSMDCTFDISKCDVPCPFGFRVAKLGDVCAESCECASKGITEGDVMFNDEVLPNMMEDYGLVEPTQNDEVSLFASTLGIKVGKWEKQPGQSRIKIPFHLDKKAKLDPEVEKAVLAAHKRFAEQTCIDFVPAKPYVDATTPWDQKSVVFMDGRGCATFIGTTSGGQFPIYLSPRCAATGVVQHEIMHMLGYHHEHCHPLRDDYVDVLMDRIQPGVYQNFKKMKKSESYDLKVEYDKKSLLHYGGKAFSIGFKPTIIDKATNRPIIHQRQKFTEKDIQKINTYYCPNSKEYIDVDGAIAATAPPTADYGVHHWASWSLWTNCYLTCSATRPKRYRYRTCQERTRDYGIQYRRGMCEGERKMQEDCAELQPCDGKPPIPPTTRPPKPYPRPSRPGVGSTSIIGPYSSSYNKPRGTVVGSPGSMGNRPARPSVVNPGAGNAGVVKPGYGGPKPGNTESSGLGDSSQTYNIPNTGYGNTGRPAYGATANTGRPAYGATGTAGKPAYGATANAGRPAYGATANAGRPAYGATANAGYPSYGTTGTAGKPAYGATGTAGQPAYGATGNAGYPSYGATGTPGKPAYGATGTPGQPAYGATGTAGQPAYGATGNAGYPSYGTTGTPGKPAYGATGNTGTPGYGNTGSTGYGNTGTPGYGSPAAPQPGAAAWTPWLQWTSCWKTCGTTTPVHRRYRTCKGTGCIGKQVDTRKCPAVQPCSMGTAWQQWGQPSKCTKNCGGGFQYRYRKCPQSAKCPGLSYSTRPCNTQECFAGQNAGTGAVGGSCTCPSLASDAYIDNTSPSWGPFGPAQMCSRSCGSGKQYRYRKCLLNGRPTTGCPGQLYDLRSCNTQQCPGGYGDETSDQVFDVVSEKLLQVCPTKYKNIWLFGNFNADKKIDVMCGEKEGGNMKIAMSTTGADFFLSDDMAPLEDCGGGKKLVADFDGDGADDILCRSPGKTQVKLMRKSGEFASGFDYSSSFCRDGEIKVLDFTGDGESDVLCWNKDKKSRSIFLKRNKEI